MSPDFICPDQACRQCARLVSFLEKNRKLYPDFFNAPVPSLGDLDAELLIVGLAPGLKGANRTGRPFTGDFAGDLLYGHLHDFGFSSGTYQARPDDDVRLINARLTNAVRCVPPENKPTGEEVRLCGQFLAQEIKAMPNLKVILVLGGLAHNAVLSVLGQKKTAFKFAHNALHTLNWNGRTIRLLDTYHTSRYNVNTGKLTPEMFTAVFKTLTEALKA
ncbi:MAG: uracil-DNA glycosylase [Alphaproteobacteria bacterium]|nr:uracil-DNA glycosylase [Alphaproteobacteria bacterium]